MEHVEIRFENEDREGIMAVGTYLGDAGRRLGIGAIPRCADGEEHDCKVLITSGQDLLSPLTTKETESLSVDERKSGYRLACQAKIESAGELVVMTEKKKAEQPVDDKAEEAVDQDEQYRKKFAELPLEKKIANLVQLEAMALGDTFAFVINSPFKIAEKLGDVMAEFGFKKEEHEKRQARPSEHRSKKRKGGRAKKADADAPNAG